MSYPHSHISTQQAYSTGAVPITPVATPGLKGKYVTHIVVIQGGIGDIADWGPMDETYPFTAGQQIDVICLVSGRARQTHTVSIHWFYNGIDMKLPIINGKTSEDVTSAALVYFTMRYPAAGVGMAKIFYDLPSTDAGDQPNDPYLAAQITFVIVPATAGTPIATPAGIRPPGL